MIVTGLANSTYAPIRNGPMNIAEFFNVACNPNEFVLSYPSLVSSARIVDNPTCKIPEEIVVMI